MGCAYWVPLSAERVKDFRCTEETLSVDPMDGRTITVPLAWFPRLLQPLRNRERTGSPAREA